MSKGKALNVLKVKPSLAADTADGLVRDQARLGALYRFSLLAVLKVNPLERLQRTEVGRLVFQSALQPNEERSSYASSNFFVLDST